MDLVNALSMQGPLEKQSPSLFKIFQDRYFAVRSQGQFLVWFKKKPTNVDQKPQGILQINTINECIPDQYDQTIFRLNYGSRDFVLRAESADLRQRWTKYIQILMAHQKKMSNFKKGPTNKNQSWRWDGVDKETSEKIRIQNEKILLSEGDNTLQEKSQGIVLKLLKLNYLYEYQKGIVHGFHKTKGLFQNKTRWFFLCSDFNLQDQEEEPTRQRMSGLLQDINKQIRKARKGQKQDSSDQQENQQDQKSNLKCNVIYQLDEQTQEIKQSYPIQNLVSWEIDTSQTPNRLIIRYYVPVQDPKKQLYEEPKEAQIVLANDYLVQLKKWEMALKILYSKLGVQALREKQKQKIGQKYQIDAWKTDEQGSQWIQRSNNQKITVFLTKSLIRIQQKTFLAKNITEISKQEAQIAFKEIQLEKKQGKKQVIALIQKDYGSPKILIYCQKQQSLKNLLKKISKLLKNNQKELSKQMAISSSQKKQTQNQINPKTYHLDKLMKERSSSIKVNFYSYMQRDPKQHQRKQKSQSGFLDKIMGMFCGNQQGDDLFS